MSLLKDKKFNSSIDQKKLEEVVQGLLDIIEDHNFDLKFLEDVISNYKKNDVRNNVKIITASSMKEKEKEEILEKVKKLFNLDTINPEYIVDESIIGGIIIKSSNKLLDASIKGKLDNLRQ